MFASRSAITAARRVAPRALAQRSFTTSFICRDSKDKKAQPEKKIQAEAEAEQKVEGKDKEQKYPSLLDGYKRIGDIRTMEDLLPPGALPGTVPTDLEQATGLERLEILGKMEGIDVFDMRPLDSSRVGTMDDPIVVNTAGNEQYCGCTGCPADSHAVVWITLKRDEPKARCPECGSAYMMHYIGPPDDPDAHHPVNPYPRPKDMSDFLRPEYL